MAKYDKKSIEAGLRQWNIFVIKYLYQDQDHDILDFGCGPGYFLCEAERAGYHSVTGLDIKKDVHDINIGIFASVRKSLDQERKTVYYDGDTIPFADDTFDAIVARASIIWNWEKSRENNNRSAMIRRVSELIRVSRKDVTWYVSPIDHMHYTIEALRLIYPIDKQITLVLWSKTKAMLYRRDLLSEWLKGEYDIDLDYRPFKKRNSGRPSQRKSTLMGK